VIERGADPTWYVSHIKTYSILYSSRPTESLEIEIFVLEKILVNIYWSSSVNYTPRRGRYVIMINNTNTRIMISSTLVMSFIPWDLKTTNDSKTKESCLRFGVEHMFYVYPKVLSVMELTGTYTWCLSHKHSANYIWYGPCHSLLYSSYSDLLECYFLKFYSYIIFTF